MSYEGPGVYRHYKGGMYEVVGLALWEAMADKSDSDADLAEWLIEFANQFDATDWDRTPVETAEADRKKLLCAAALLSERTFVIYEPLTLDDKGVVKFWARGKQDFDSDVTVLGVRDTHPDMTSPRFTFISGPR